MKKWILVIVLFWPITLFAQKSIIKARAIYLPADNPAYSFGVGYERLLKDNLSVQLLFNASRFTPGFDAQTSERIGFVPEARFYFGKKESIRKKMFLAGYMEFLKVKEFGGMPSYGSDLQWIEANSNATSVGVLIGKNNSIGKRFVLDMYIGYRLMFMKGSNTYRDMQGKISHQPFTDQVSSARLGLNLGFMF